MVEFLTFGTVLENNAYLDQRSIIPTETVGNPTVTSRTGVVSPEKCVCGKTFSFSLHVLLATKTSSCAGFSSLLLDLLNESHSGLSGADIASLPVELRVFLLSHTDYGKQNDPAKTLRHQ